MDPSALMAECDRKLAALRQKQTKEKEQMGSQMRADEQQAQQRLKELSEKHKAAQSKLESELCEIISKHLEEICQLIKRKESGELEFERLVTEFNDGLDIGANGGSIAGESSAGAGGNGQWKNIEGKITALIQNLKGDHELSPKVKAAIHVQSLLNEQESSTAAAKNLKPHIHAIIVVMVKLFAEIEPEEFINFVDILTKNSKDQQIPIVRETIIELLILLTKMDINDIDEVMMKPHAEAIITLWKKFDEEQQRRIAQIKNQINNQ